MPPFAWAGVTLRIELLAGFVAYESSFWRLVLTRIDFLARGIQLYLALVEFSATCRSVARGPQRHLPSSIL